VATLESALAKAGVTPDADAGQATDPGTLEDDLDA
jgi:hypothetical protein